MTKNTVFSFACTFIHLTCLLKKVIPFASSTYKVPKEIECVKFLKCITPPHQ